MFKLVLSLVVLQSVSYNIYCMTLYRMDESDDPDEFYSMTIGSRKESDYYSIGDNVTLVCKYNKAFNLSEFRFTAEYCDDKFMCNDILEYQASGNYDQLTNAVYTIITDPLSDWFSNVAVRYLTAPTSFNITIAGATKELAGGYKCRLDYVDPGTNVTRFTPTLYRSLELRTA